MATCLPLQQFLEFKYSPSPRMHTNAYECERVYDKMPLAVYKFHCGTPQSSITDQLWELSHTVSAPTFQLNSCNRELRIKWSPNLLQLKDPVMSGHAGVV